MTSSGSLPARQGPARPLGPILDFMRLLWAIDHGLETASKRMEARLGVTGRQRLVILIVGRFPGISAGEIAEILRVHPSTLTGVFRRLEKRQLIARHNDPADARRALFTLLDGGRHIDGVRRGTIQAAVQRALAGVPERRVAAARSILDAVFLELMRDD